MPKRQRLRDAGDDKGTNAVLGAILGKRFARKLAQMCLKHDREGAELAYDALCHYDRHLDLKAAPATEELGSVDLAKKFREMRSEISRKWWESLSPAERRARAKKASDAAKKARKKR